MKLINYKQSSTQQAFTLLEMLIVISIISIISFISVKGYNVFFKYYYYLAAQADILSLSSKLEKHYYQNLSYDNFFSNQDKKQIFSPNEKNKKYSLKIELKKNSFIIKATALEKEADLKSLSLDNLGKRCSYSSSFSLEKCEDW